MPLRTPQRQPNASWSDSPAAAPESSPGAHFQRRPRPAAPYREGRVESAQLLFCVEGDQDWDAGLRAKVATPSVTLTARGPTRAPGNQPGEVSSSRPAASVRRSPNSSRGDGQVQASFPEPPGKAGCLRTCGRARQNPGRQASEAPGKVLGGARGGALEGAAQVQPVPARGRRQKASDLKLDSPRTVTRAPPFRAGSQPGAEGGAEVVSLAGCLQVPARTRALRRVARRSRGHRVRFPGRPEGWLQAVKAQFCSDPSVLRSQSHALREASRGQALVGTIALRLQ